jgi:hypothetical protein
MTNVFMKTSTSFYWVSFAIWSVLAMANLKAQTELFADQLTIQQSAKFGTLIDEAGGTGFTMDVLQTQYETETIVCVFPPPVETQEYQEVWDYVDMGYYQENWGTQQVEYFTEATYDEYETEITPGTSYWVDEPYLISSEWISNPQWAVVGHEYVTVWTDQEPYEEVQYITNFNHPVVRFTGSRSNTEWLWRNPAEAGTHRPLMKLGTTGLSFPLPFESTEYDRKSLLNYYQVLYSKTNHTNDDTQRVSQGSRITEEGITVWNDAEGAVGQESRLQNPVWADEVQIKPNTLEIRRHQPQLNGSQSEVVTAVSADFATFGGGASFAREVSFHGEVRIQPRGDLSMGAFTQGPQP